MTRLNKDKIIESMHRAIWNAYIQDNAIAPSWMKDVLWEEFKELATKDEKWKAMFAVGEAEAKAALEALLDELPDVKQGLPGSHAKYLIEAGHYQQLKNMKKEVKDE